MSVLAYMGYYYYDVTYLLVILGASTARLNVTAASEAAAA